MLNYQRVYRQSKAMASFGTTACQSFPIVMTCHGWFAALIRCSKIDMIENELYPGKPAPTSVSYNAILPLISQIPCYTLGFCQKKHPIFIAAPDQGWSSQCRWSSAYQLRFDLSIRAWLGKMMRDRPSHFWGYQGRRKCTSAILMHGLRHKYRTQVVPKFIRPHRTSRCNFRRSRLKTVDPVDMILLADHLIIRNGAVFRLRSRANRPHASCNFPRLHHVQAPKGSKHSSNLELLEGWSIHYGTFSKMPSVTIKSTLPSSGLACGNLQHWAEQNLENWRACKQWRFICQNDLVFYTWLAGNWNDHPSIKCIGGWRFPNPWGVPLNHPCFFPWDFPF